METLAENIKKNSQNRFDKRRICIKKKRNDAIFRCNKIFK